MRILVPSTTEVQNPLHSWEQEAHTTRTMTDKTNLQNKGWERIPHIWYRRPIGDTYRRESKR